MPKTYRAGEVAYARKRAQDLYKGPTPPGQMPAMSTSINRDEVAVLCKLADTSDKLTAKAIEDEVRALSQLTPDEWRAQLIGAERIGKPKPARVRATSSEDGSGKVRGGWRNGQRVGFRGKVKARSR